MEYKGSSSAHRAGGILNCKLQGGALDFGSMDDDVFWAAPSADDFQAGEETEAAANEEVGEATARDADADNKEVEGADVVPVGLMIWPMS